VCLDFLDFLGNQHLEILVRLLHLQIEPTANYLCLQHICKKYQLMYLSIDHQQLAIMEQLDLQCIHPYLCLDNPVAPVLPDTLDIPDSLDITDSQYRLYHQFLQK
jgi:hypothetical protein